MFDFAIIGSGVSGGRVAYELTRAGAKCVLIEAGKSLSANTFPNNELDYSSQLFWGGGLELSQDGRLGFLRAKVLGGTSIVNQALLDEFDEFVWDDWRSRTGVSFFNSKEFQTQYDAVFSEVSHSEIDRKFWNKNTGFFTTAFDKLGYGWKPLVRAQKDCKLDCGSDCIVCLGGCPRNSKQSALVTTIQEAAQRGLAIESELEVREVSSHSDSVRIRGIRHGSIVEIEAGKAFLAAGALGNSAILLRSGFANQLPALGTRFTCHPQLMTYAVFNDPIDAHKGAFQAVKSNDKRFRVSGLKFENVFAPPIGTAMLLPGIGRRHHQLMKKYRYMASMEVALRDDAVGKISVAKNGKIMIEKKMTNEDKKRAALGLDHVKEFFLAAGAKEENILPCHQGFGLHLMGGCPMGSDGAYSVVDPDFRLHGSRNIYVADSSVFPSAPGINPSFTIMALSRMAAMKAVAP